MPALPRPLREPAGKEFFGLSCVKRYPAIFQMILRG